ncbi:MAG: toxin-antitoxin system YwqK family antitoxin [Verrucomicrobiales bacterium]|nr:toxin-antitoxin system YwqK family antitoxin [Verrucomicrobiales bacterium]
MRTSLTRFLPSRFTLSLLLVAVLTAVAVRHSQPRPTAAGTRPRDLREVTSRDLVPGARGLVLRGETNPFTGAMVERYPSGALRSRALLVHGRLEGPSEGWYTNGALQVREYFEDGVSHGPRRKWYPSGRLLSEAPIVHGKIQGVFRRWHENGRLAVEVEMAANQPHGVARTFDEEGVPRAERHMDTGALVTEGTSASSHAHQGVTAAMVSQGSPP